MFEIWEVYRNSGRLDRPVETGFTTEAEAYARRAELWGDRHPDYNPFVVMDADEAGKEHEAEVHGQFHTADRPDWTCPLCDGEGWNK